MLEFPESWGQDSTSPDFRMESEMRRRKANRKAQARIESNERVRQIDAKRTKAKSEKRRDRELSEIADTVDSCHQCGGPVLLIRKYFISDDGGANAWKCRRRDCNSSVMCHPGTTKPMGRMADSHTRTERHNAHLAFDPLWRDHGRPKVFLTRVGAYQWLATMMRIPLSECHIGQFNREQCLQVIELCKAKRQSV